MSLRVDGAESPLGAPWGTGREIPVRGKAANCRLDGVGACFMSRDMAFVINSLGQRYCPARDSQ